MNKIRIIYFHNYLDYEKELFKNLVLLKKFPMLKSRKYVIDFAIKNKMKIIKYRLAIEPNEDEKNRKLILPYRGILYKAETLIEGFRGNCKRIYSRESKRYTINFPKKWHIDHKSCKGSILDMEKYGKLSKVFYLALDIKALHFYIINKPVLEYIDINNMEPVDNIRMIGKDSLTLKAHGSIFPVYDITEIDK